MASRRQYLRAFVAVTASTAGCGGRRTETFVPERVLLLSVVDADHRENAWKLEVELRTANTGRFQSSEEGTFEDVRIIGLSKDGDVVCDSQVGDIGPYREQNSYNVRCSEFPHALLLATADAPPCSNQTILESLTYVGEDSPETYYGNNSKPKEITWEDGDTCDMEVPTPITGTEANPAFRHANY